MYRPTIGLEIHIELRTRSKMFCSCKNDSEEKEANLNVCPICLAHPGTLPAINKEAVQMVLKAALALHCRVNRKTFFERKSYFYPDLPKNYQISQYALPLAEKGFLCIKSGDKEKKIRINRVHLEEDTGRLIHPKGKGYSLVDFNRAGVPLMELVTEPDIESAEEARNFAKELRLVIRYLGISKADMEKGEMRCEVNISLRSGKDKELGTKVEVKNLNSLRSVEKAVKHEIERQLKILESGGEIIQETRGWSDKEEKTFSQRTKEESDDYRYFPEPDLPPLELAQDFVTEIEKSLPELPAEKRERFQKEYGLNSKEVEIYISQPRLGNYFEEVVSELRNWVKEKTMKKEIKKEEFFRLAKLAANYISTDLQFFLKGKPFSEKEFPVSPENFAEFISMIHLKEISSRIAKKLLEKMFQSGGDPSQIIKEEEMVLLSDENLIFKVVKEVITENPKAVEDYKKGKEAAIQFLLGKIMAKTKGNADPAAAKKILQDTL